MKLRKYYDWKTFAIWRVGMVTNLQFPLLKGCALCMKLWHTESDNGFEAPTTRRPKSAFSTNNFSGKLISERTPKIKQNKRKWIMTSQKTWWHLWYCTGHQVATGPLHHCHTLTWPVPSPVKNRPPGPSWMARISCLAKILPLSANLDHNSIIENS